MVTKLDSLRSLLQLEILSIKIRNRTGAKGQPCQSPTCTRNRSDYGYVNQATAETRKHQAKSPGHSQNTCNREPQETQSNAFSKFTKHIWTGWANPHEPSSTLRRVPSWSSVLFSLAPWNRLSRGGTPSDVSLC